jgi:UDP-N-acetylglucosamine acyltransferase
MRAEPVRAGAATGCEETANELRPDLGARARRCMIHPTAIIEQGATLGAGCIVHAYACITRHCVLGAGVVVHPFAVLGGDPQDLGFDTTRATGVLIGDRTVIREHVTVNRATKPGGATEIGSDCFLMAASHVAHDGHLGARVILANQVMLAGHVHVGDRAFLGGGAAAHQFTRIGESAMVGGHSRITRDVAPFLMAAERDEVAGLNLVGLRRRGTTPAALAELKRAYREVFAPTGNLREFAAAALANGGYQSEEALRFLRFFESGKRGFIRPQRRPGGETGDASEA